MNNLLLTAVTAIALTTSASAGPSIAEIESVASFEAISLACRDDYKTKMKADVFADYTQPYFQANPELYLAKIKAIQFTVDLLGPERFCAVTMQQTTWAYLLDEDEKQIAQQD